LATGSAVPEYVIASVPEVVTGLPEIDKKAGTDAATEVTVPVPFPLKVDQSALLRTPRLDADAVGTFNVMTGVVVPFATVELRSVPDVPSVNAATEVTVPPPPPEAVELIVWLGQVPEMVTLVPATSEGVVVPVPPLATGSAVPEYAMAKVPEVVMGLPVTDRNAGTVAATEVTVPEPPEANAAIAAVVVRTVAPVCTIGTISAPVKVPEAVRFDIEVLAMSYPWSR
jgi:hypothetical protein